MAKSVRQAIRRMRRCERSLSKALHRAGMSGQPERYAQVARRIKIAERRLHELEQELHVA